jgi:hypothetical protein
MQPNITQVTGDVIPQFLSGMRTFIQRSSSLAFWTTRSISALVIDSSAPGRLAGAAGFPPLPPLPAENLRTTDRRSPAGAAGTRVARRWWLLLLLLLLLLSTLRLARTHTPPDVSLRAASSIASPSATHAGRRNTEAGSVRGHSARTAAYLVLSNSEGVCVVGGAAVIYYYNQGTINSTCIVRCLISRPADS